MDDSPDGTPHLAMLQSEREGLVWLAQKNSGQTVKAIAARVGRTQWTVYKHIRIARGRWPEFAERIRIIMNGVVGECLHGLPVLRANGEQVWVCADCAATNDPENRAFRRGTIGKPTKTAADSPAEIAAAVQPHGAAKFRANIKSPKAGKTSGVMPVMSQKKVSGSDS